MKKNLFVIVVTAMVLASCAGNELHYQYSTPTDRLAVFSEIYYPNGWKLTLLPEDGAASAPVELPLFRADWTLRAALLPAGSHQLVMTFFPESYRIGATISRVASLTLLLLLVAAIVLPLTFLRSAPAPQKEL